MRLSVFFCFFLHLSGFFSFSPSGSKLTQHNVGVYSCDGTVLCRCHWGYIDIHESCTDGLTVLGNYLVRTRKQNCYASGFFSVYCFFGVLLCSGFSIDVKRYKRCVSCFIIFDEGKEKEEETRLKFFFHLDLSLSVLPENKGAFCKKITKD